MSKKLSWDDIAKQQFQAMDPAAREDWRELRAVVYGE
jgi:hypothetical protein